ncbi:MAG: acyl carrier protein [Planctomycetota bacterium]|jgi:acyl carrier protein
MTRREAVGLLESALNETPGTILETTELESLPGWDSVGMLSVMALVDAHAGVVLPPDQIAQSATVRDLLGLFEEKLN